MGAPTTHHDEMLRLANHIEQRGDYANLDDPTRNQFQTSVNNAMRAIFSSDDHHQWGYYDNAHADLLVAGNHISVAGKMLDQAGNSVDAGMGISPKSHSDSIAANYKKEFRS